MRIGNSNGYSYAYALAQKNKSAANSTNKTKQSMPNLMDALYASNNNDEIMFNYASMLKNAKNRSNDMILSIDSLRIDPSKPLNTPERVYKEMLPIPQGTINHASKYSNRVTYSEMFLGGLGDDVFNKYLSDKDIILPEDSKFDINVSGDGKVNITGLDDEELTHKLEETMSYDFPFIRSVLTMFEESKRTIENGSVTGGMGMSYDQHWKMLINSSLQTDYETSASLTDLSIGENGKIQGLPESLYNKIYGDRKGMSQIESDNLDFLRDKITYLINKGPDSISAYSMNLTYSKGKVSAN